MVQQGRSGRLHPAVGTARGEMARVLNSLLGAGTVSASGRARKDKEQSAELSLLLAGVSGGPDSLALAAVLAHFARRGEIRAGAVIVDHGLQEGSAQVAAQAAEQCQQLGLDPVLIKKVQVETANEGPEKAAQLARYSAFAEASAETQARGVLLGHTLNDQAETVLLGLSRGSGTKSLAGMPEILEREDFTIVRPLLALTREQIEDICEAEGLEPWYDPTNADETMMRSKVRHTILPFLEEHLGGDVATSLARTAAILGADSEYLDAQAEASYENCLAGEEHLARLNLPEGITGEYVVLNRGKLADLPDAVRRRVLAQAVKNTGGFAPSFERLTKLDAFSATNAVGGPVQLTGHVSAWKARPAGAYKKTGLLIIASTRTNSARKPHSEE